MSQKIFQFIGNGGEYRKLCSELSSSHGRLEKHEKKYLLEAEDGDDGAGDHDPDGRHEDGVQHLVLARAGRQQPVADLKWKRECLTLHFVRVQNLPDKKNSLCMQVKAPRAKCGFF